MNRALPSSQVDAALVFAGDESEAKRFAGERDEAIGPEAIDC